MATSIDQLLQSLGGIAGGGGGIDASALGGDFSNALQGVQQHTWATLLGFVPGLGVPPAPGAPTTTEQGITGWYIDPTTGQPRPTQGYQSLFGTASGAVPDASGYDPTLAGMEQTGHASAALGGGWTLPAEEAMGFLNRHGAQGAQYGETLLPTLDEQKFLAGLVTSAGQGFADPFTNLAKNRTLAQSGFLGNILRGYIQQATGKTTDQLAAGSNLTNAQLAGDIANSFAGGVVSPATSQFLNTVYGPGGSGTNPSTANGPSNGAGAGNSPSDVQHAMNLLWQSNPIMGPNPGFQTPMQMWSRLSPSAQSAYIDLQQQAGPNGQTKEDFLNQVAAGSPQFGASGAAKFGSVAGM